MEFKGKIRLHCFRGVPGGLYYKNLILGICCRLITMNKFQWSNDLKIRAQIQWFKIVSWKGEFEFTFHL